MGIKVGKTLAEDDNPRAGMGSGTDPLPPPPEHSAGVVKLTPVPPIKDCLVISIYNYIPSCELQTPPQGSELCCWD
eukprot:6247086-Pyramimonas_sp.AAC.1